MLDFDTLEIIKLSTRNQEKELIFFFIVGLFVLILLCKLSERLNSDRLFAVAIIFTFLYPLIVTGVYIPPLDREYRVEVKDLTNAEEKILMEDQNSRTFKLLPFDKKNHYIVEDDKLYLRIDISRCESENLGRKGVEDRMNEMFEEDLLRNFGKIKTK